MGEIHQAPHIIMIPSPGMGHLIPLITFAKWLVTRHDFLVTFLIPTEDSPTKAQKTVLSSLPKSISYTFLPPVSLDDLSDDAKIETRISLTMVLSIPSMRDAIGEIQERSRIVALVVDLFGTDVFDVGKEFGLPPYIFFPSNATTLSLLLELPKLDESCSCEYRDLPEPVKLPGCVPLHGGDLLDPAQDRKNEAYAWLLHHCKRYKLAEGILVNSFDDLEPGALKALEEKGPDRPAVYPIGPLIQDGSDAEESECLRWLDNQPLGSVLFVSFGSGGTLSSEQLMELAIGLEMSEQRFLWVVRSPSNKAYLTDPFSFLPKGFSERTKGFGLVVSSWAPQIQILGHPSTGGFLTHCGWNSTLESAVHGVPLIAWPLYAEQKMNSVLLESITMALRVQFDENGIVRHGEIAKVVRGLMEGEEGTRLRKKMKDLKMAATTTLSGDGSSTRSLYQVARNWNNQN